MLNILFLHGFRANGKGTKANLITNYFKDYNVISPKLPIDPAEVIPFINEIIKPLNGDVTLIGSSLGGFYSLYFASKYNLPAILINPSLTPWITLEDKLGTQQSFDTFESFEWKREYLNTLKSMGSWIENLKHDSSKLSFFLSNDDELLDHTLIPQLFQNINFIKYYENCGHRFTRFEEILGEIKIILNAQQKL